MPSFAPHRASALNPHGTGTPKSAIAWHTHESGQFILVETGVSHLCTEVGAWAIPARRVAWVPPGVRHISRSSSTGRGWVIIAPSELGGLPDGVCVVRGSALMLAALERLARLNGNDGSMRGWLWHVVASEMADARPEPLVLPMPTSPRLLRAARSVLTTPSAAATLDELAQKAGMSRRSFARHFGTETGLSVAQWKRAVIAHHALELVAGGQKVSSVALDVGYESVSAFIAMFRRQYGQSPRQFLIENSAIYHRM